MYDMLPLLEKSDFPALKRQQITTLQINLGYQCNQSCQHCHVNAGPKRTEKLSDDNVELLLQVLSQSTMTQLDLTGGAPELHPRFEEIVLAARAKHIDVIDRCNLTILFEPNKEHLADFLAQQQVEIVASLPCYTLDNVDKQRGKGVFDKSIAGLQKLNSLGYGQKESGLQLNLVYNPQGAFLPPSQKQLEQDYKRELYKQFGIVFNQLFVITNMPIQRFGSMLVSKGQFTAYIQLLKDNYCVTNLDSVMCKTLVSVDWQGYLYDCDFNQQLGLEIKHNGTKMHLRDCLSVTLQGMPIRVAKHCYACTAGQGSSCGGAL